MKKLLVIIPTKNQKNNLVRIVSILRQSLMRIDHQIIISNNSESDLNPKILELGISYLKTPQLFATVEQHIFWILEQVRGEYVWFLGDDDIPIQKGVKELAKLVNAGNSDCFTFNGLRMNSKPQKFITMINAKEAYYGKLVDFYENFGLLNGPASISLYVTRKKCLKKAYIYEIKNLNAPIYSHLTLFLRSFSNLNFVYHPINIVQHLQSDKEQNSKFSSNWIEYAEKSGNFYFFPWTLGLLRNLNYLVNKKAINKNFLSRVVETDPRNRRYQLLPQIEDYIRQIFVSQELKLRIISKKEMSELSKYIARMEGFRSEITNMLSSENPEEFILAKYPHTKPWVSKWISIRKILKYRFYVLLKQVPKDLFWILITKFWVHVPRKFKPTLKKIKFVLKRMM